MKKLVLFSFAMAIGFISSDAFAKRAKFKCSEENSGGDICYFSIYYFDGGIRNFTMRKGESDIISGLHGNDEFCISMESTPNPRHCNRIPVSYLTEL